MNDARRTRPRPSALQQLPAEADGAVALALDHVITRASATQTDALLALNEQLAELGFSGVSPSAFSRFIRQFRQQGIPPRYRLGGAEQPPASTTGDPLVALIDRRIEEALFRRGLQA